MTAAMTDETPITWTDEQLEEHLGVYRPDSGRPAPDWAQPSSYPRLFNISAGMLYGDVMVRAENPSPTE